MSYAAFLERKARIWRGDGFTATDVHPLLHDWQRALVRWATKKGRCALFCDTGLGKTFMQVEWARIIGERTLIVAPLCVAEQTALEAAKLGVEITYARNQSEALSRLSITNYERLDNFDAEHFGAVVLDESSILKSMDGKTRTKLIAMFDKTRYRLCCTATPSPNDIAELANHSEFLGLMRRPEFLASWFVHDDEGWRMKRHAVAPFYRWMASWAMAVRRPSDLGYDDGDYALPPLNIVDHVVGSDKPMGGALFPELGMHGIGGRLIARQESIDARVAVVERLAQREGQWIIWCGLNSESERVAALIPNAVEVKGSDTYAEKVAAVQAFQRGEIRHLVSKGKILGYGLNFQNCRQMAFLGLSDSFELYYQCIRRCYRYGQKFPVDAHVIVSEAERLVVENVRAKEAQADAMSRDILAHMRDAEREELSA